MATGLEKLLKNIFNGMRDDDYGQNGADFISTTGTAYNGNWKAIKADGAADVTFTTLTTSEGDDLDGLVLVAGDVIYGPFTTLNISAGKVIAYKKSI